MLALALLFGLVANRVLADVTVTQTITVFPSGVATGNSSADSTAPLACDIGCFHTGGTYISCFINKTRLDGTHTNQSSCDTFLCNQTNFYGFSQCLNCIIANGGERPFGYPANETFNPSAAAPPSGNLPHLDGWIDTSLANAMLKNITDRCSSISQPLSGDLTITATATTTGPYNTVWTSGQTKNMPQWTGLTQYSNIVITNTYTLSGTARSTSLASAASASASTSSSSTARSGADRNLGIGSGALAGILGAALFIAQH